MNPLYELTPKITETDEIKFPTTPTPTEEKTHEVGIVTLPVSPDSPKLSNKALEKITLVNSREPSTSSITTSIASMDRAARGSFNSSSSSSNESREFDFEKRSHDSSELSSLDNSSSASTGSSTPTKAKMNRVEVNLTKEAEFNKICIDAVKTIDDITEFNKELLVELSPEQMKTFLVHIISISKEFTSQQKVQLFNWLSDVIKNNKISDGKLKESCNLLITFANDNKKASGNEIQDAFHRFMGTLHSKVRAVNAKQILHYYRRPQEVVVETTNNKNEEAAALVEQRMTFLHGIIRYIGINHFLDYLIRQLKALALEKEKVIAESLQKELANLEKSIEGNGNSNAVGTLKGESAAKLKECITAQNALKEALHSQDLLLKEETLKKFSPSYETTKQKFEKQKEFLLECAITVIEKRLFLIDKVTQSSDAKSKEKIHKEMDQYPKLVDELIDIAGDLKSYSDRLQYVKKGRGQGVLNFPGIEGDGHIVDTQKIKLGETYCHFEAKKKSKNFNPDEFGKKVLGKSDILKKMANDFYLQGLQMLEAVDCLKEINKTVAAPEQSLFQKQVHIANGINYFVQSKILEQEKLTNRLKIYHFFILLAHESLQKKDYSTSFAIWSALSAAPLERLKTEKGVKFSEHFEDTKEVEKLKEMFNHDKNYKFYRETTKKLFEEKNLFIPILPLVLKDIEFLKEGNIHKLGFLNIKQVAVFGKIVELFWTAKAQVKIFGARFSHTEKRSYASPLGDFFVDYAKKIEAQVGKDKLDDHFHELSNKVQPSKLKL